MWSLRGIGKTILRMYSNADQKELFSLREYVVIACAYSQYACPANVIALPSEAFQTPSSALTMTESLVLVNNHWTLLFQHRVDVQFNHPNLCPLR